MPPFLSHAKEEGNLISFRTCTKSLPAIISITIKPWKTIRADQRIRFYLISYLYIYIKIFIFDFTGFKFSRASYVLSLLRPKIVSDLELKVNIKFRTVLFISTYHYQPVCQRFLSHILKNLMTIDCLLMYISVRLHLLELRIIIMIIKNLYIQICSPKDPSDLEE